MRWVGRVYEKKNWKSRSAAIRDYTHTHTHALAQKTTFTSVRGRGLDLRYLPSLITNGPIAADRDGLNRDVCSCNGACGGKTKSHRGDKKSFNGGSKSFLRCLFPPSLAWNAIGGENLINEAEMWNVWLLWFWSQVGKPKDSLTS